MYMKKISDKHKIVVDIYLSNGLNKTQALIDAGYSSVYANKNINSIFSKSEVKAYIAQKQALTAKKYDITRDYITAEYLSLIDSAKKEGLDGQGNLKDRANWAKALGQLSKLLGLDEPEKIQHSGEINIGLSVPGLDNAPQIEDIDDLEDDE